VRLGIIEKGEWIPLSLITTEIEYAERHDSRMSVSGAIAAIYKELTSVTITFTPEEVVELTHRINLSSSVLATVYRHDDYTAIEIGAKHALFHKLNAANKSPI
jgi:hypothetical protein